MEGGADNKLVPVYDWIVLGRQVGIYKNMAKMAKKSSKNGRVATFD